MLKASGTMQLREAYANRPAAPAPPSRRRKDNDMIIATYRPSEYTVHVHVITFDGDGNPFATVYKNNEFHHHTKWTEAETQMVNQYIAQAIDNPQFPKVIEE